MIVEMQYPTLLSGVSEQTPRERSNNQFTAQENMISDPVSSLRRRVPLVFKKQVLVQASTANPDNIISTYTEVGGKPIHLIMSTYPNVVMEFYDLEWNKLDVTVPEDVKQYLTAENKNNIRITNNSGITWLLNTAQKPVAVYDKDALDPKFFGYTNITTGAFLKKYKVSIVIYNKDGTQKKAVEFEYETPDGTNEGDASKSTPEGVATSLAAKINADNDLDAVTFSSVIWISLSAALRTAGCSLVVKNASGSNYASASNAQKVPSTTDLPAELPDATGSDGFIMGVGSSDSAMQYYKYSAADASWSECGAYGSISAIKNMPVSLNLDDAGNLEIKTVEFEGRVSGNDLNNPEPVFITQGITGISTYSGRLVLLSGPRVYLSATRYPIRFMRSSAASVLDDDPIEVAASSTSSASFEHAVQFNKDLVIFSKTYQAVIPAGNQALSPLTAMLVVTSQQPMSTTATPCVVGQTLMFITPMSTAYTAYFGVGELVPSEYTNSVYTPQNLTEHLPRYMRGDCNLIVSGGNNNIAVFLSSDEKDAVIVHEYMWQSSQRQLMSWSKWRFRQNVASAHMCEGQLHFILASPTSAGNEFLVGVIDPRSDATRDADGDVRNFPYLDLYIDVPVTRDVNPTNPLKTKLTCTLPAFMKNATIGTKYLALASTVKGLYGEPIGIQSISEDGTILIDSSYSGDTVTIGYTYKSFFEPNSPIVFSVSRDTRRLISDTKDTLLRTDITLQKSGEFQIEVKDDHNQGVMSGTRTALLWSSKELCTGNKQINSVTDVIVPCRTNAHTTSIVISTEDTRELNVLGLVYVVKLHQQKGRKRV